MYAAGDIARWPDPRTGERIRVEHWVVAQRQGQSGGAQHARADARFDAVPFFWSQHYDIAIEYVGHAERWDRIDSDGDPAKYDFRARFIDGERVAAVATIYRDLESLQAEAEMEARAGV